MRASGAFTYPELRLIHGGEVQPRLHRAFARLSAPGVYAATITKLIRVAFLMPVLLCIALMLRGNSATRSGAPLLPWFAGLLVVGPVVGHASWHAYRAAVAEGDAPAEGAGLTAA